MKCLLFTFYPNGVSFIHFCFVLPIVATAESKVSFFSWPRLKFHRRKPLFNNKFVTNLLGSSKCTVIFPIMIMLIIKAVITDLFLLFF